MKWYYLALLTWLFEIILLMSIILIPICIYLRDNYSWFNSPFSTAELYKRIDEE